MSSGRVLGEDNYKVWLAFCAERPSPKDWASLVSGYPSAAGDRLHRERLVEKLGFADRGILRQNPKVRQGLEGVEAWLRAEGVLLPLKTAGAPRPGTDVVRRQAERIERLERENAALKAENRELREGMKRYEVMDRFLAETGRVPR